MNTEMEHIFSRRDGRTRRVRPVARLPTAAYAEYTLRGPGANAAAREMLAKQLTSTEAKKYETKEYLRGVDGWDPMQVK